MEKDKNQIFYTTIEQSRKLLELGLKPQTADMWWLILEESEPILQISSINNPLNLPQIYRENIIPCWSINALLGMMEYPRLFTDNIGMDVWFCKSFIYSLNKWHEGTYQETPIVAVYNEVVWLLENNYILDF